jgi:hypothetical protein
VPDFFWRETGNAYDASTNEREKMQSDILKSTAAKAPWLVTHSLNQEDSVAVTALRSMVADVKGKFEGTAGRGPFNGIMERVAAPEV